MPVDENAPSNQINESLMAALKGTRNEEDHSGKEVKPLHYQLAALGLPTIPQHMAQRIWNLDFIKMEEFLPSSKTMHACLKELRGPKRLAAPQHSH